LWQLRALALDRPLVPAVVADTCDGDGDDTRVLTRGDLTRQTDARFAQGTEGRGHDGARLHQPYRGLTRVARRRNRPLSGIHKISNPHGTHCAAVGTSATNIWRRGRLATLGLSSWSCSFNRAMKTLSRRRISSGFATFFRVPVLRFVPRVVVIACSPPTALCNSGAAAQRPG